MQQPRNDSNTSCQEYILSVMRLEEPYLADSFLPKIGVAGGNVDELREWPIYRAVKSVRAESRRATNL